MLPENSLAASVGFDYDSLDGGPEDPAAKARQDVLEAVRWFTSYVNSKERARLTLDCLALALGDGGLENVTMTAVAKRNGVTKAAISKRVKDIARDLRLPVTANNKSSHASRRYAQTNVSPVNFSLRSKAA